MLYVADLSVLASNCAWSLDLGLWTLDLNPPPQFVDDQANLLMHTQAPRRGCWNRGRGWSPPRWSYPRPEPTPAPSRLPLPRASPGAVRCHPNSATGAKNDFIMKWRRGPGRAGPSVEGIVPGRRSWTKGTGDPTHSGLRAFSTMAPRVARSAQPWAK